MRADRRSAFASYILDDESRRAWLRINGTATAVLTARRDHAQALGDEDGERLDTAEAFAAAFGEDVLAFFVVNDFASYGNSWMYFCHGRASGDGGGFGPLHDPSAPLLHRGLRALRASWLWADAATMVAAHALENMLATASFGHLHPEHMERARDDDAQRAWDADAFPLAQSLVEAATPLLAARHGLPFYTSEPPDFATVEAPDVSALRQHPDLHETGARFGAFAALGWLRFSHARSCHGGQRNTVEAARGFGDVFGNELLLAALIDDLFRQVHNGGVRQYIDNGYAAGDGGGLRNDHDPEPRLFDELCARWSRVPALRGDDGDAALVVLRALRPVLVRMGKDGDDYDSTWDGRVIDALRPLMPRLEARVADVLDLRADERDAAPG